MEFQKNGEDKILTFYRKEQDKPKKQLKNFLKNKTNKIREVVVFGCSYNSIDYIYFDIIKSLLNKEVKWNFYYHSETDKANLEKYIVDLKLNINKVTIKHSSCIKNANNNIIICYSFL